MEWIVVLAGPARNNLGPCRRSPQKSRVLDSAGASSFADTPAPLEMTMSPGGLLLVWIPVKMHPASWSFPCPLPKAVKLPLLLA